MSTPALERSSELLDTSRSRLVLIDLQVKLLPVIPDRERVIAKCRMLAEAATLLTVPIAITEQYPKGLGSTVPELAEFAQEFPAKTMFSGADCLGWSSPGPDDRFQVVLAGIETHVCVLQTALDLLARGFAVSIVADAVAARGELDHQIALRRLECCGATITTAEGVLFEWCATADRPEFKTLSQLVKGP